MKSRSETPISANHVPAMCALGVIDSDLTTRLHSKMLPRLLLASIAGVATIVATLLTPPISGVGGDNDILAAAVTPFVSGEPAILFPGGNLPERIYILANGAVNTEIPASFSTKYEESFQGRPANTQVAGVTVLPSRLLMVDDRGRIVEIWSNTKTLDFGFFILTVRTTENRQLLRMTQSMAIQYNSLRGQIDWSRTGRVWSLQSEQGR